MAAAGAYSTPVNTLDRSELMVLVRNNILNYSAELATDADAMETDSPVRKPRCLQPVIKKLFHSPIEEGSPPRGAHSWDERGRRRRARKRRLVPDAEERIKRAYVRECEGDGRSPDPPQGMRKRVLISLFHNKEYSMDCGE